MERPDKQDSSRPLGLVTASELLLRMAALVRLRLARSGRPAGLARATGARAHAALPVSRKRHTVDRSTGPALARGGLCPLPARGQRLPSLAATARLTGDCMPIIELAERGLVPDALVRLGIRRLCSRRLEDEGMLEPARSDARFRRQLESLRRSPLALATDAANAQHYEVPTARPRLVVLFGCRDVRLEGGSRPAPAGCAAESPRQRTMAPPQRSPRPQDPTIPAACAG